MTTAIWTMLVINAGISALFAHAIGSRREPWGWPPSWVRVVTLWLGSKTAWLIPLAVAWQQGWIGYIDPPHWARTVYPIFLLAFTCFHGLAAFYYVTGRAALPPDSVPWNGGERRRFKRRQEDRDRETPLQQMLREQEELP